MPGRHFLSASLLAFCTLLLLPDPFANAHDVTPSGDMAQRYADMRRQIEEGERHSRALPPSPRQIGDKSIIQLPVDTKPGTPASAVNVKSDLVARPETDRVPEEFPRTRLPAQFPYPWPVLPPCPLAPGGKVASLVKVFTDISWHVCVRDVGKKELWVGPVDMRRNNGSWVRVIGLAGLADIYVPYDQINFDPYDLEWTSGLDQVFSQFAPNGNLITLTGETVPTVVAETRERGVGWLCEEHSVETRRAQEFVVWGIADGGNYDNIVEYSFHDDGAITFRTGNTGFNWPLHPVEPHVHNALWRVDIDLNGGSHNRAFWLEHNEPGTPYSQEASTEIVWEAAKLWDGQKATKLLITDAAQNHFGNHIGYTFAPLQYEVSRHYRTQTQWTHNDVYVTRYNSAELGWMTNWTSPDNYLLPYLNNELLTNKDMVVWVKTSVLHPPGDEDRSAADAATGDTSGVTLTHWSGFRMDPHDLFNANPLGAPSRCWP